MRSTPIAQWRGGGVYGVISAELRCAVFGAEEKEERGGRRQGLKCPAPCISPPLYRSRRCSQGPPIPIQGWRLKGGGLILIPPTPPYFLGLIFISWGAGRLGLGGLLLLAHVGQGTPSWSHAGLPKVWAPLVALRNLLDPSDTIPEKSELFPEP